MNVGKGCVMWWMRYTAGIVLTVGVLGLASTGVSEGPDGPKSGHTDYPISTPTQSRQLTFTVQRPGPARAAASAGEAQLTLLAQTPEMNIRVNRLTGRIKRHTHPQSNHFLYLIQGQIELTVGEETRRIQVGDFVTIPQGSVHAMQRVGTAEALFLDIASPPDVGDVIWQE